jgi:hypothetical protein
MVCGGFSESKRMKIELLDVDGEAFMKALDLWCGREDGVEMELRELQQLASVADRYQITEVINAVDELLQGQLGMDNCEEWLTWSGLRLKAAETSASAKALKIATTLQPTLTDKPFLLRVSARFVPLKSYSQMNFFTAHVSTNFPRELSDS